MGKKIRKTGKNEKEKTNKTHFIIDTSMGMENKIYESNQEANCLSDVLHLIPSQTYKLHANKVLNKVYQKRGMEKEYKRLIHG